jgi:anti-sigma regulatory factor (Ser/Thr protein kinase)
VSVEVSPERVLLRVVDQGHGFTPELRPAPDAEQIAGRGLWLIQQLADEMRLRAAPGGGCDLEAEFRLPCRPREVPVAGQGEPLRDRC